MKSEIKIFENEKFGNIRIVMSENGEPLFCLVDLCEVLDLTPSKVAQRLEEDVLSKYPLETAGGIQQVNFVNEDGMYDTILDSRKPEAKQFRKWITSDVLPSIRKTGSYSLDTTLPSYQIEDPIKRAEVWIEEQKEKQKLALENKEAHARIEKMKPKEEFYDTVTGSEDTIDMRQVATTLNIKGVGRNKMFEILRAKGILDRRNIPYQIYVERGYFRTVESSYTKGDIVCINIKTVVFQKGVDFIKKIVTNYIKTND